MNILFGKKIIGYKLVKEDYQQAVNVITGTSYSPKGLENIQSEYSINKLKEAGVLNLWFEPVYEPEKPKEEIVSVGGKFDVVIKDNKIWHKNDDITKFVKEMIEYFSFAESNIFGNYSAIMKDVVFSKTGCQNVETKLSDWKKVWDKYQEFQK